MALRTWEWLREGGIDHVSDLQGGVGTGNNAEMADGRIVVSSKTPTRDILSVFSEITKILRF